MSTTSRSVESDRHTTSPEVRQDPKVIERAIRGERHALDALVRSFLPDDERIIAASFLGTFGVAMKYRSFFAVTDRRVISIELKPGRGFVYTDGMLEHVNSSGIGQPSKTSLYAIFWSLVVLTWGIALITWPLVSRAWHRKNKSGIFLSIREGRPVQAFVDEESLPSAVDMYRQFSLARDDRLAHLALATA